jgi:hypothetical protein
MRHYCKNFIEGGRCTKCRTPEWAIYFPEFKHKIGSKVRVPQGYTDEGKIYSVLYKTKIGYAIGESKDNPIESYSWWEIYPLGKAEPLTQSPESNGKPYYMELFSGKLIPRKRRYYLKDKEGLYYIPEVQNAKED